MAFNTRLRNLIFLFAVLPLAGCLFRTHEELRPISTAPLQEGTKDELVQFINANAARLQSLRADVDFDVTVSKQKKPKSNEFKVTEYPEFSGYLLVRKPELLRLIGLAPALRNTVFDMVGDAKGFSLSIPVHSEFFVGSNQVVKPSSNMLLNLRPQAIFDALLLKEIDPQSEIAVLVNGKELVREPKNHKEVQQDDYELMIIRNEGKSWFLSRKIIFSRVDLRPDRLISYDPQGRVATDAAYEAFKDHDGVLFPGTVLIERPVEGFTIQLTFTKLNLNPLLKDEQFALSQPPGYKLIDLDHQDGNTAELNLQTGEAPKPAH
jgi:Domain of unknown function (DUF4292)